VAYKSLYKVFVYKKLNLILTKELRGTQTDMAGHVHFYQLFFFVACR
jgi:hypothetical protein